MGYFCAPDNPRNISSPNHPSGLTAAVALLPNSPYKNATGAIIHAWRPAHWYTNVFEVGSASTSQTPPPPGPPPGPPPSGSSATPSSNGSTTFMFARGGTQGGEGATEGESWYIENVLEELDMGREWYFDASTATLIYRPNVTEVGLGLDAFLTGV